MDYIRIVDLDEMNNLVIQSFFIWGHLVSHLSKFDQVKFGQMKKQHFGGLSKFSGLQSRPRPGTRTKGWVELSAQKYL